MSNLEPHHKEEDLAELGWFVLSLWLGGWAGVGIAVVIIIAIGR